MWAIKQEEIHCIQVHDVKEAVLELSANSNFACFSSQGTGVKVSAANFYFIKILKDVQKTERSPSEHQVLCRFTVGQEFLGMLTLAKMSNASPWQVIESTAVAPVTVYRYSSFNHLHDFAFNMQLFDTKLLQFLRNA